MNTDILDRLSKRLLLDERLGHRIIHPDGRVTYHEPIEWVVTPAAVEIIAKEQERDQIEAELRAAIENMIKLQERAKEIAAAETPHPLVAAIDIMHRSARRMPNRWPEF